MKIDKFILNQGLDSYKMFLILSQIYLSYIIPSLDIMLDDFDAVDFDIVTSIHDMKDAMSNNLPT